MNQPFEHPGRVRCESCGQTIDAFDVELFDSVVCPHCSKQTKVCAEMGKFRVTGVLGEGSMGSVYLAVDRMLDRPVAIKLIRQTLTEDERLIDTCLNEARAQAALNHPNVVKVHSVGQKQGMPFIVMELVTGGKVDGRMLVEGAMDEKQVLRIAIGVTLGLKAADEAGLVHGDIKPANILLDEQGEAKLTDFGIARFADAQKVVEGLGTPFYIAPEVAKRQASDRRSDIYSLGATLFHMLAGDPPFQGENSSAVIVERFKAPAPYLRDIRADLHDQTADVVARMLQFKVFDRYQDYDELLVDLRTALSAVEAGPAGPVPVARAAGRSQADGAASSESLATASGGGPRSRHARGQPKRRGALPLILVGGGVAVAVVVGVIVVVMSGGDDATSGEPGLNGPGTATVASGNHDDQSPAPTSPASTQANPSRPADDDDATPAPPVAPSQPKDDDPQPTPPPLPEIPPLPKPDVPDAPQPQPDPALPTPTPDPQPQPSPAPAPTPARRVTGRNYLVFDGKAEKARTLGAKWIEQDGYLESAAANNQIYSTDAFSPTGDFHLHARLAVVGLDQADAAFVINATSFFLFDHSALNHLAVKGDFFAAPNERLLIPSHLLIADGQMFTFDLYRRKGVIRIEINGTLVYRMLDGGDPIKSLAFNPRQATMRLAEMYVD